MRAFEAFIGSFGILVSGILTIPLAGGLVGVDVTMQQGAIMSALFFVGRFAWLYLVRVIFSKIKRD